MAVVFAESPSAAFAANSNLDQQRVQNYLNSIAQNQRAQLDGYNAAAQQAARRQAAQERQQTQALEVAQYIAKMRQAREAETYNRGQDALTRMLENKKFDRNTKFQDWQMGQSDAAMEEDRRALAEQKSELAKQDALEAQNLTRQALLGITTAQSEFKKSGEKLEKAGARGGEGSLGTAWDMLKLAFAPNLTGTHTGTEEGKERAPANIDAELKARIDAKQAIYNAFQKSADSLLTQNKAHGRFVVNPRNFTITPLEFSAPTGGVPQFQRNPLLTAGATAPAVAAPAVESRPVGRTDQPSLTGGVKYFRDEGEARAAGITPGVPFMVFDPASGVYRRARLTL